MKPLTRHPLVSIQLITACALLSAAPLGATTLTGALEYSVNSDGQIAGGSFWNTYSGYAVDLFLADGNNLFTSPFINGPDDAHIALSISLSPGTHTYSIYGGSGASNPYHALNLYFNGDNVHPGIMLFAATQT